MSSAPVDPPAAARPRRARRAPRRLPEWLSPRDRERPGSGNLRLVETTLLVIAAILLATATVYDVFRQAGVNERMNADARTWRAYTHRDFKELSIDQVTLGLGTGNDVVCGNKTFGWPGERTQVCLMILGPTRKGMRRVYGGWYLPPQKPDAYEYRYGCFGDARHGLCPRT